MKRTKILLASLLAGVILCTGIIPVYGYFTANTQSSGGLEIKPIDTSISETVVGNNKNLVISNSSDGAPVYVRARGFSGDDSADLSYSGGEGWVDGGDGWWYYTPLLLPEDTEQEQSGKTTTLSVDISKILPEDAEPGDNFNVVVVYESVLPMDGVEGAQATFAAFISQEGGN